MTIKNVIDNGYCIGCGVCKLSMGDFIKIEMTDDAFYRARFISENDDLLSKASRICPFSSDAENETDLAKLIYENKKHDERIGCYNAVYAGCVIDNNHRYTSSSGGLTTWFAKKLLENNEVDAVIHVGYANNFFGYKISRTIEELDNKSNKKSRYYPVTFDGLIQEVNASNDRFLFVGIPCFIKAIRLAQKEQALTNIKFVVSLLCGHMKSADFANNLAWQMGINPQQLGSIDFRVKQDGFGANDYFVEAVSLDGKSQLARNSLLFGTNWGLGFFKHKSCDFCDDLSGELADVTFGDAWLPQFTHDSLGTNIVVSRCDLFDKYLSDYTNEVFFESLTVDDFFESRAGNYRHRRDGLICRIENTKEWTPTKRLYLSKSRPSSSREKIYLYRRELSDKSINLFKFSKKIGSYTIFRMLMLPYIVKYDYLNNGFVSAMKLFIKQIMPMHLKNKLKLIIKNRT